MRTLLSVLTTLCLLAPAWAGEAKPGAWEQKAAAARVAYDAGDYKLALARYEELLAAGLASADLYYNLGNTEFKNSRLGRAIAYYRRAAQMSPGDKDICYNLTFARNLVKRPPDKTGALTRLGKTVFQWVAGQTLAVAAWACYMLLAIVAGGLVFRRGQDLLLRWAAALIGIIFIFLAIWASLRIMADRTVNWGVIVVNQAEARNGPAPDYEVGFKVPVGREVRVLGQEGRWIAIGLTPEGYKGWIQEAEIWQDDQ